MSMVSPRVLPRLLDTLNVYTEPKEIYLELGTGLRFSEGAGAGAHTPGTDVEKRRKPSHKH